MKTWLKGGLIAIVIFFILFGIAAINNGKYGEDVVVGTDYIFSILLFPTSLIVVLLNNWFHSNHPFFLIIFDIIFYFIIGAVIGLIYDKIKSKEQGKIARKTLVVRQ
jgi:hypothetical protein